MEGISASHTIGPEYSGTPMCTNAESFHSEIAYGEGFIFHYVEYPQSTLISDCNGLSVTFSSLHNGWYNTTIDVGFWESLGEYTIELEARDNAGNTLTYDYKVKGFFAGVLDFIKDIWNAVLGLFSAVFTSALLAKYDSSGVVGGGVTFVSSILGIFVGFLGLSLLPVTRTGAMIFGGIAASFGAIGLIAEQFTRGKETDLTPITRFALDIADGMCFTSIIIYVLSLS